MKIDLDTSEYHAPSLTDSLVSFRVQNVMVGRLLGIWHRLRLMPAGIEPHLWSDRASDRRVCAHGRTRLAVDAQAPVLCSTPGWRPNMCDGAALRPASAAWQRGPSLMREILMPRQMRSSISERVKPRFGASDAPAT